MQINENLNVMKAIFIIFISFIVSGCAIFFPDSLEGDSVPDEELGSVIFINEVSADDPNEDDWVELYNSNSDGIDLSDFYLSDDDQEYTKWDFPRGTFIAGKSYLVVVCDGDNEGIHTSFKLSAGSEGIYLTSSDGITVLDSISAVPNTGTGSYGRTTNGGSTWGLFTTPTKGGSNS